MKGKYEAPAQKKSSKKGVALLLVLFLLVGCVIGGTVAYLTAETKEVKNVFTAGSITSLTLAEGENLNLKMVPGQTITKDPKITVGANSEACYVYVKIEESDSANLLDWTIDTGWTQLNTSNIYYRAVNASTSATELKVLLNNQVSVSSNMTNEQALSINDTSDDTTEGKLSKPTLSFTAYAVQQASFNDAAAAWTATFGASQS